MRTTSLPPHLTAQTLASQPMTRPQPQPLGEDGFQALALKSAAPARVIAPRLQDPKPLSQDLPAPVPTPAPLDESTRLLRPGSRLDIRV